MIVCDKLKIGCEDISYIYSSNGNENLVLLFHGFGSDMHERGNFDILADKLLKNNIDCLRFNYLGHGDSSGHTEDLTFEIAINEALELLNKYPHKKVSGVGVSYGGALAILLTGYINFERLVLWSPLVDLKNNIVYPQNHFCKDFLGDEALNKIKNKGYALFGNTKVKFNMNIFNDALKYGVKKELLNYKKPVKIFHGNYDLVVPYEQSLALKSDNVCVKIIDGATHCFYDESSSLVINETVDFLK